MPQAYKNWITLLTSTLAVMHRCTKSRAFYPQPCSTDLSPTISYALVQSTDMSSLAYHIPPIRSIQSTSHTFLHVEAIPLLPPHFLTFPCSLHFWHVKPLCQPPSNNLIHICKLEGHGRMEWEMLWRLWAWTYKRMCGIQGKEQIGVMWSKRSTK